MENNIIKFKEVLRQGMIENFKRDGSLTPILFVYKDGEPDIMMIPPELFSTQNGKEVLAQVMKNICHQPNVLALGLITEAYGAKLDAELDSINQAKIESGEIKVSELDNKVDIILMIFSTPEKEEMIAYEVDCENKVIGDLFGDEEMTQFEGMFANFFDWNKN